MKTMSCLLGAALLMLAAPARAGDATPQPTTASPMFSGCTKSGRVCFAPSVALTIAAVNLNTGKIEAAFSPGLGYGFIVNPGKFNSLGADFHFIMDPGAQNASLSLLGSFFNGFMHVGVSKGFVGDKSWRLLAGPSFAIPL